jgi:hypothetical protein
VPGDHGYLGCVDATPLVPVAAGVSDFEAKLLAARLGADGILWQTRGIVDSIYPFGGIDVLVPRDQLEEARRVLGVGPDEVAPADDERAGASPSWWFGVAASGAAAAVAAARLLTLG